MMLDIIYLFVFLSEVITSYIFFKNKYKSVYSSSVIFGSFLAVAAIQYLCNLTGNPYINLIVFFASYFIIGKVIYKSKWLGALFDSLILTGLMMSTEFVAIYILQIFTDIDINTVNDNLFNLVILSITTKLLYFAGTFFISKLTSHRKNEYNFDKHSIPLLTLPLASILVLIIMDIPALKFDLGNDMLLLFSITSIILLYSNILVFTICEHITRLNIKNAELMLQNQKSEIDTEHYHTLQTQQEKNGIIIHDIKKHLIAIRDIAAENNDKQTVQYIDELYKSSNFDELKVYSNNKLVNVIINRFALKFNESDIRFYCDIRDIDFGFLKDNEITSLLDNLLSNAFEAAVSSEKKEIDMIIKSQNDNFVILTITNTCGTKPKKSNGKFITSKKDGVHGTGLKSISNIIKKYDASLEQNFDETTMTFKTVIVFCLSE